MELVCFSNLFQPLAHAAPQDRAVLLGERPQGLGRAPPAPSPVPGPFSGHRAEGCMLLCCPREGSWRYPSPGLQSGHGQFLCCGRSVEGEGVTARSVILGWPKERKRWSQCSWQCLLHFFLPLNTSYNSNLYYMVYKTQSRNQSLQILSETETFVSYWHYPYCHQLFGSERSISILCLKQLFICSLFNVYRWLFPFCIHLLQSNIFFRRIICEKKINT